MVAEPHPQGEIGTQGRLVVLQRRALQKLPTETLGPAQVPDEVIGLEGSAIEIGEEIVAGHQIAFGRRALGQGHVLLDRIAGQGRQALGDRRGPARPALGEVGQSEGQQA